jgi:predicted RecB family nuclease
MPITESLFLAYCRCPYKAFLKSKGEVGVPSDYEVIQNQADARFKVEAIDRLLQSQPDSHVLREPPSLAVAIKKSVRLIVGAGVEALGAAHKFDLLERHVERNDARRPAYVPVHFCHSNKLTKEDTLVAGFQGIVLAQALGRPVPFVKVVHGSNFSVTRIELTGPTGITRVAKEARQTLDRLRKQTESASPPLMILNSHCPACEFKNRCHAEAVNKDDLSLIRGLSEKEILAQRQRGITSVTQFACTFRPQSIGIKRNKPLKRHLYALQALAVRDKKVYVVRAPEMPTKVPRVYLDAEGLPDRDFHYLVGVVVEAGDQALLHSFWADDETEEQRIWVSLLNLLRYLGEFTLFHYGAYEKDYIKKMLRKYPSPDIPLPNDWASTMFNVLGAIRNNVYFPTCSNGLKDIGKYLGIIWSGMVTSGIECIAARLRWEESKDPVIKEQIIDYNRRDCWALQRVTDFLLSIGSSEVPSASQVQLASEIRPESQGKFGSTEFAMAEMRFINKCARFNYQRDKVLIRTDPAVRASARRKQTTARPIRRADADVRCNSPPRCPYCSATQVRSIPTSSFSKLVYDLKFTKAGVKRWVMRYVSERNLCTECRKTFYSDTYPTHQQTGHALASWEVYQHVALRLSFADIASSTNDLFGYAQNDKHAERAQTRLAKVYRVTVDKMLTWLNSGMLIHADETKIGIKTGRIGYVWALTSTETVVYLYHPTREGTFLKENIGDFGGVLVSDFYAAYDSVTCRQQKCHLHLMRDINDDLLRHPFDEELKELARRYTLTLKPMVETIDKHGLKTKFLSKHKRNAENFLDWVATEEISSEVVQGYKSRIGKYGGRLFTFLDYDGVPWNNNNSENALKLVASRRRLFGTSVSEAGLKDYLVFLSIYQTLRRKGFSLLRFLLSGATDLEEFVRSYRRRS